MIKKKKKIKPIEQLQQEKKLALNLSLTDLESLALTFGIKSITTQHSSYAIIVLSYIQQIVKFIMQKIEFNQTNLSKYHSSTQIEEKIDQKNRDRNYLIEANHLLISLILDLELNYQKVRNTTCLEKMIQQRIEIIHRSIFALPKNETLSPLSQFFQSLSRSYEITEKSESEMTLPHCFIEESIDFMMNFLK